MDSSKAPRLAHSPPGAIGVMRGNTEGSNSHRAEGTVMTIANARYTQGPWTTDKARTGVVSSVGNLDVGRVVAQVYTRTRVTDKSGRNVDVADDPEGMANARLIEAAPDMFKALLELSSAATGREATMGDPCGLIAAKDRLSDATRVALEIINKVLG